MTKENVAIKTTDLHKEGMDIIDFLRETYNVSSKHQSMDEFKTNVLQHAYHKDCYWIGLLVTGSDKDIFVVSDCDSPKKRYDDLILFDNFSDFKKYIKDMGYEKYRRIQNK